VTGVVGAARGHSALRRAWVLSFRRGGDRFQGSALCLFTEDRHGDDRDERRRANKQVNGAHAAGVEQERDQ
jgi:hypothetical protein